MKKPVRPFVLAFLAALASCSPSRKLEDASGKWPNVLIGQAEKGDPYGPCEPSICVSPSNPKQVVAGAILDKFYWSNDAGRTWAEGKIKSKFGVFGDPVIAADWKGNFFFAHLADTLGKGWSHERLLDRMVVQKSTDGGRSWDDGSFAGEHHPRDQDKPWLCVDPKTGEIAMAWTEFDQYNSKKPTDRSRILFSKSSDGGASWSPAVEISEKEGDCLDDDLTAEGAVPAFGPSGEIFVAWAFDSKIWFDRSLDGGKTWLEKDIVIDDQPGGWTFEVPGITRSNGLPVTVCDLSLGPNRGTIYVNWSDQRAGEDNTDIFISKSSDGGKTWSKTQKVNTDKRKKHQFFNWLAIDQATGWLYCLFYDRREQAGKMTDVALAVSKDGAKTWKNYKISESPFEPQSWVFFGDYSQVSAHGGVIRPIWTRLVDGKLSVWTALVDMK